MTPVDFLLYCTGASTVSLSIAASIRLIMGERAHRPVQASKPDWQPVAEPVAPADGLQDRLQSFQSARFSSPIVQRRLGEDAGPRVRPVVIPPRRDTPFSRPVQPKLPPKKQTESPDNNVIPLPVKPKRDEEPPKEE